MTYQHPQIFDYGSIAENTFSRGGGCGPKVGGCVGARDKNCEFSLHSPPINQCDCGECPCFVGQCGAGCPPDPENPPC